MERIIRKAGILIEALPYIRKFRDRFVVVKYGGSAIDDDRIRMGVLEDLVFMSCVGMKPVLVHGGGNRISRKMHERGKKPKFINGSRVTDKETIKIAEEVLLQLNCQIVREIKSLGGAGKGFSGRNGGIIRAARSKLHPELGFVGDITAVRLKSVKNALAKGAVPVISSLGLGKNGEVYNVNADYVSARIACELKAEKLAILTNVRGIMRDENRSETLMATLTVRQAGELMKENVIKAGMIPKVRAAVAALKGGSRKAHIIDARISHSLLLEIFTDRGIGTEIVKKRIS